MIIDGLEDGQPVGLTNPHVILAESRGEVNDACAVLETDEIGCDYPEGSPIGLRKWLPGAFAREEIKQRPVTQTHKVLPGKSAQHLVRLLQDITKPGLGEDEQLVSDRHQGVGLLRVNRQPGVRRKCPRRCGPDQK